MVWPWTRIGFTVGVETGSAFDEVARINPDMPDASGNVRLVEAAPDMLAALEALNAAFGCGPGDGDKNPWIPGCISKELRRIVRTAIYKAKGML